MATIEERLSRVRSHIHTALLETGTSFREFAARLDLEGPAELSDYLQGRQEMPLWLFLKFAEITGKPVWWFFDEPPKGITLEAAEVALQNVARIRLYLEAVESELANVKQSHAAPIPALRAVRDSMEVSPRVVDFGPYLERARAILAREVEAEEPSEVSDESVEMVAQGLFNATTGVRRPSMESLDSKVIPLRSVEED